MACALFRANAKEAAFAGLLGWLDSLCLLDWLANDHPQRLDNASKLDAVTRFSRFRGYEF